MSLLWATVTATSPLTVTLDGSATAVPAVVLSSYTATLSDRVAVVRLGSSLLVLGKVV